MVFFKCFFIILNYSYILVLKKFNKKTFSESPLPSSQTLFHASKKTDVGPTSDGRTRGQDSESGWDAHVMLLLLLLLLSLQIGDRRAERESQNTYEGNGMLGKEKRK